ncbi:MAG TPA: hypothetical protein DIT65_04530 [Cryomorphaceae bacterium]|nr:hypothetical protein [Cryomorphaceae bacterium]|tara:strand:+ start:6212 stop:7465 length:1254 start_codon:yes stop_codon:yes gene_type:complete
MRKFLVLTLSALILLSCGVQKSTVPGWVSAKPIDEKRTYVYGVGMSYINPNTAYQQAARSNALADLAGEVESQVFDESRLLQKEDLGGFSSSFSSQTLTTSHIKLEGYELVHTYSDELRYYVLYKLDLPQFLETKAKNDAIAMAYIDGKLEISNGSERPAGSRFQALADALQKGFDRQFLKDPKFKIELNAKLINGLRSIERDLTGSILLPETTNYLGLPEQFSAVLQLNEEVLNTAVKLTSSSGNFSFNSALGSILCEHTGRENAIILECPLDFKRLLPQSTALVHLWLEAASNWKISESLFFQNTIIEVKAPGELQTAIAESISSTFNTNNEAPLILEFKGSETTERNLGDRTKHIISGSFILKTSSNTVLWSSQRLMKFGISTNPSAAKQTAYAEFDKDIRFFIVPQIIRNLGY